MTKVRQSNAVRYLTARNINEFVYLARETSIITNQHHGLVPRSVGVGESVDFL